ncbi:MAG: entericidin A/B family lipoprotein [Verrucomicrobiota bacterium]|nr:entericidin A/B family lipoprotein [Verrucomicrobiota bacterium]
MNQTQLTRTQRVMLLVVAAAILNFVSVGCNTAHGFGKDVERTGEKIQDGTK